MKKPLLRPDQIILSPASFTGNLKQSVFRAPTVFKFQIIKPPWRRPNWDMIHSRWSTSFKMFGSTTCGLHMHSFVGVDHTMQDIDTMNHLECIVHAIRGSQPQCITIQDIKACRISEISTLPCRCTMYRYTCSRSLVHPYGCVTGTHGHSYDNLKHKIKYIRRQWICSTVAKLAIVIVAFEFVRVLQISLPPNL